MPDLAAGPTSMRVPVVIAGASFGGLAAARALGPNALLLDRAPLGAGVTSACGAPVSIVERMGAAEAILQRHDHLVIEVVGTKVRWPLPEPFCTFDYPAYCRLAFQGSGAEFRQASVRAIDGGRVDTSIGTVEADYVIDATGPRSALTAARRPHRRVAFGIETEIPAPPADGLWFSFPPEVRDGYAWAFPCGSVTRFGVLSYRGRTKLMPALRRFVGRFGLAPGSIHGGYLATGWETPSAGRVFRVGDAAGHCLPLTGEGIRIAILAGERCGRLLHAVVEGRISVPTAAEWYSRAVGEERRVFRALVWANLAAVLLPRPLLAALLRLVSRPGPLERVLSRYLAILARDRPEVPAPGRA